MSERDEENKVSTTFTNQDDVHHEHIGAADKSDVSPSTAPAAEAAL